MDGESIELTPNYENLYQQFAREATLKAETILADCPDLGILDHYRVKVIQAGVLRAFQHILNSINICAQSTVRASDVPRLREMIHGCVIAIQTKADGLEDGTRRTSK